MVFIKLNSQNSMELSTCVFADTPLMQKLGKSCMQEIQDRWSLGKKYKIRLKITLYGCYSSTFLILNLTFKINIMNMSASRNRGHLTWVTWEG